MVKVKRDLTGRKFGKLTVLKQVEDYVSPKGKHEAQWLCECSCDEKNMVVVRTSGLQSGTSSCGCLKRERTVENNKKLKKKYNKYDLSGKYGIGYTSKGQEFYFDLEDYDKIKDYSWHLGANGYVMAKGLSCGDKNIQLHRLIMNILDVSYERVVIDHIHGKETRNDNRKSNLRLATVGSNNINVGLRKNNTSGITGINWNKRLEKWHVRIWKDNREIHLGYYDENKFDEAVKCRKEAEERYFGEWSYDNSQSIPLN